MKKIIKKVLYAFIKLFYRQFLPNNYPIKKLFLYIFMQKIIGFNRKVQWPVHFSSQVVAPHKIKKGTFNPGYSIGTYLDGRNGIIFEENVRMSPRVSIISQNHSLENFDEYVEINPVIVRKNSLLLTNSVILPGVELGEYTIVAAGAVVTKSFPEGNQILAGVPAKIIKKLENYNV